MKWFLVAAIVLAVGGLARAGEIDALLRAYPAQLAGVDGGDLIWRDGTRMPLGPAQPALGLSERLRHGSILDQIGMRYPAGAAIPPAPSSDPGRIRNRAFFDKMYGDCRAGQVAPRLARVIWLPHTWGRAISVTTVNGVDRRLAEISRELDELPASEHDWLHPIGGTYKCRPVADTGEPSMHAYGAAIDINPARSQYWLWRRSGGESVGYVNTVPADIVAVFERHGFIWGGRWAHFDTMHFEYRPELLGFVPPHED
jgi:hypothetical protein